MKYPFLRGLMPFLCVALSACGGGKSSSGSSPSTPTPSVTPPTPTVFDVQLARQTGSPWQLVWADEFNTDQLDKTRWQFEVNCAGGGNHELQCYREASNNTQVANGQLAIIAQKEAISGDEGWTGNSGVIVQRDYSSARINTHLKGDWRYGRIEVRAKLPKGQGIWPAIWMLPSENVYGNWPLSGEIDIMEAINLGVSGNSQNRLYGTIHYGAAPPNNKSTQSTLVPDALLSEDFHTYAIEWQKGEIRWYFDDVYYGAADENTWFTTGVAASQTTSTTASPFDQTFHLILNLAVGGNWPGAPDNSTQFPQTLAVDFVRVYSCSSKNTEGWGCATLPGKTPVYAPL